MSSRNLPARPHLDHLKNEAKALQKAFQAGDAMANQRVRDAIGDRTHITLTEAQRVIAREYGFPTWAQLRAYVQTSRSVNDTVDDMAWLTFTVIRFAEGAAHPPRGYKAPGMPRLGEDTWVFPPSSRRLRREEVPAFLAGLPSPAMLFPTTTRGVVAIQLLSELSGDRAAAARKEFANQRSNLEDMARQLGLAATSQILLEVGDEARVVPLDVFRQWSERFAVHVGWNVGPLEGDSRARARLNLFRSDGVNSWDRSASEGQRK
jgi:hypothetical protein